MNIRTLIAGAALSLSMVAPALADTTPQHMLLGHPVHLSLSAGTVEERVVGTDATNITGVSAHLSSQLTARDNVYLNGSESYVSHSGALVNGYSALTGSIGINHEFSNRFSGTVEAGNRVNDQQYLGGANRTIPYVGVSVTDRVF